MRGVLSDDAHQPACTCALLLLCCLPVQGREEEVVDQVKEAYYETLKRSATGHLLSTRWARNGWDRQVAVQSSSSPVERMGCVAVQVHHQYYCCLSHAYTHTAVLCRAVSCRSRSQLKQACLAAATYQVMVKTVPVSCVSQAVAAACAAGCFDGGTTPHVCTTHPTSSCALVSCHAVCHLWFFQTRATV